MFVGAARWLSSPWNSKQEVDESSRAEEITEVAASAINEAPSQMHTVEEVMEGEPTPSSPWDKYFLEWKQYHPDECSKYWHMLRNAGYSYQEHVFYTLALYWEELAIQARLKEAKQPFEEDMAEYNEHYTNWTRDSGTYPFKLPN